MMSLRFACICFGIGAVGVFYFLIDPAVVALPDCPFYSLTHLYCPGCGSQRGLHALLHGDLFGAMNYNPLMVLGLGYLILEAGIRVFHQPKTQLRSLSSRQYTPLIVFVIILIFWILRNIPVSPFTLLAP